MSESGPICFWSYTHRDDELEGGRIRRLATYIANNYELLTGEALELFVDRTAIEWGDELRAVIDTALTRTAFFIPVVTPNYLRSEECRREFVKFAGRARAVDAFDLLLPILYVDTPQVADENSDDEVARLIRQTKYVDWRELRLADESQNEYRSAVHSLAVRIVKLMQTQVELPLPVAEHNEVAAAGIVDQIAEAEESAEAWVSLANDLSDAVKELGTVAKTSTDAIHDSDRRGGGMRGRLVVLRRFGEEIEPIAERIGSRGSEFSRSVVAADPGIQALIREAQLQELGDEGRQQARAFFGAVRDMAGIATTTSGQLRGLMSSMDHVSSLSRVARKPLNKMRGGLSAIVDATTVLNTWAESIQDEDEG